MSTCKDTACGCGGVGPTGTTRREFLTIVGTVAAAAAMGRRVVAGPFDSANDYLRLIPKDKRLAPAWVASLFERGAKQSWTDPAALRHIGMPVGGCFAGTVYLGGDGTLWQWDIFNNDPNGIQGRTITYKGKELNYIWGANYVEPAKPLSPFDIGFSIGIGDVELPLSLEGFSDVTFEGRYPIGTVRYASDRLPVKVRLDAFSPFTPLNMDDSSLPAVLMRYTLHNTGTQPITARMSGRLRNPIGLRSRATHKVELANRTLREAGIIGFVCAGAGDAEVMGQSDFGTMALAILDDAAGERATVSNAQVTELTGDAVAQAPGEVRGEVQVPAGGEATVTFVVAWHFPNLRLVGFKEPVGHHYATRFPDAPAVVRYVRDNLPRLDGDTRKWVQTWYDSSLPYWLLDRAMANTSTLATTTCYRMANGRMSSNEGVGCCPGTCAHVWHYAQAAARLFPSIERDLRERVDFGLAMRGDGGIAFRAWDDNSFELGAADDAQAGRVLCAYREYLISGDEGFVRRIYPNVKRALEWLIARDGNADGAVEVEQHNTLDAQWFGKIPSLMSLYLAALRAGAAMATLIDDPAFATRCGEIAEAGKRQIEGLFNGEYFVQEIPPEHQGRLGHGKGCFIDQVIGQWWAHEVGLGRLFDADKQRAALKALWEYNFVPDIGPFRDAFPTGRWYAMAGDAGLLMCTWPKELPPPAWKEHWQFMYFNECMSGFEWQVAAHMVREGMVTEGLAVARAIHDRYDASLRNPYNEIECSDHYVRAMASYSVFLAACGFEYDAQRARIGFAPALTPEAFRAPFTAAEGWGTYSQQIDERALTAVLNLHHGTLRVQMLALALPEGRRPGRLQVTVSGEGVRPAKIERADERWVVRLEEPITLRVGASMTAEVGWDD
jgi:uncharacterized protein (DUF608 family)